MLKKRLLPAAIIVAVTLGFTLLSRPTRVLFFTALAVVSAFELDDVLRRAGRPAAKWLLVGYSVVQGVLCYFTPSAVWSAAWFGAAAFAILFAGVLRPDWGADFAANNLFALVWPFGFYTIVLHAAASDAWLPVLSIGILGAWACDSMALIGGRAWGRHKLAPAVSPNKTWEGAIIGGLTAILAGLLISLILGSFFPVPALTCMAVTFVSSCFGQAGDLIASLIKRAAGVKDYGSLMPEHGGIMDKMDSLLFSICAAYLGLYIAGVI